MSVNKEDQKYEKEIQTVVNTPVSSSSTYSEDPLENLEGTYLKYQKQINAALTIVALVIVGFIGYKYYIKTQEEEASSLAFQAEYYWEADSLTKALNGDGTNPGLIEIADSYGLTKSGNLAKFRVGTAYLKQGKFEEAIASLKDFSSSDLLLQARAYALIGDANMDLKKFEEAADYYEKASGYKPNKEFTPLYLLKQGLAQEKANDLEGALKTYTNLEEEYPNSPSAGDARKYKGLVESQLGK